MLIKSKIIITRLKESDNIVALMKGGCGGLWSCGLKITPRGEI